MYSIDNTFYCPALRGKAGEFIACSELHDQNKDRLLPYFVLPSYTAKENKDLSGDQVIADQVGKIWDHWKSRPCLLDLRFLRFDADAGSDAARVNQLLTHARSVGCRVIPVIGLATDYYRTAAASAHAHNAKSGACLRVTLTDLSHPQRQQMIATQLSDLGIPANECLVALDLGEADLSLIEDFAKSLIEWLVELRGFGTWRRIIVLATNYPRGKNPAPADGMAAIPRSEWAIWQRVQQMDQSIRSFAMFGDYGADNARIDFSAGGKAITHLRYATPMEWLIVRGSEDRNTIRSIVRKIAASANFSGESFSAGDEFIGSRARGLAGVGNPMIWRWVNMNHHMTLVTAELAALYGAPIAEPAGRRHPVQEELFVKM
ncbi:MAG: beta family protein [Alphaproteobacteria bacterium]